MFIRQDKGEEPFIFFTHCDNYGEQFLNPKITEDEIWVSYKVSINGMTSLIIKTQERKTKFEHWENDGISFLRFIAFDSHGVYAKKRNNSLSGPHLNSAEISMRYSG